MPAHRQRKPYPRSAFGVVAAPTTPLPAGLRRAQSPRVSEGAGVGRPPSICRNKHPQRCGGRGKHRPTPGYRPNPLALAKGFPAREVFRSRTGRYTAAPSAGHSGAQGTPVGVRDSAVRVEQERAWLGVT